MKQYTKRVVVGSMETNCYIILDEASNTCIIIDPGDDADYIERVISDTQSKPVAILATHGHIDHVLAAHELKLAYDIPFAINPKDKFLLARLKSTSKHFLGIDTLSAPSIDINLKGNYHFGKFTFQVIDSPGHTPGSVCLLEIKEKFIISGDLVFTDGYVGRSDFAYSDKSNLEESLSLFSKLPKDLLVLPGHGDSFILGDEF